MFTLTIFAAVRAVDPDTKCSINRSYLYVLKRLFRISIIITFLGYLGQPLEQLRLSLIYENSSAVANN